MCAGAELPPRLPAAGVPTGGVATWSADSSATTEAVIVAATFFTLSPTDTINLFILFSFSKKVKVELRGYAHA